MKKPIKEKPCFVASHIGITANVFSINKYTIDLTLQSSGKISKAMLNRVHKQLMRLKLS